MFQDKLKYLRKSNHYTMDELIDAYNKKYNGKMNKSTLSRYENGLQEPMFNVVRNLANFFDVSIDYLVDENRQDSDISDLVKFRIKPISAQRIPFLGEIACGKPIYADEERESYIEIGTDIDADFCLRAKGDSMINARIHDGDIVFIKKQSIVNNGEIAAVIIEDEATLKRVYYYPESKKLLLNAENPIYEPLMYVGEELEKVRILGLAIAFQSDVR